MERDERERLATQLLGKAIEEDDAVGRPGDSAITLLLLFSISVAVSGSFACGCAIGYSSPVQSAIMEELHLSTSQFSLFGSLLTAGTMLGSLVSGKIAERIGRRGAMGLSDALIIVGWIAISISQEAWSLYLGRFFIGVSAGILYYVVPVYIAEVSPKDLRGRLVSLAALMMACGIEVIFFVGSLIPWRPLVLIGIFPSLLQLLCIFVIPESPRFLAMYGQSNAHEIVLQRIRGADVDISQEATDIDEFTKSFQNIPAVNFIGLFQRKYAHALLIVNGLMALAALGSPDGVTYYASAILQSAGFSSSIGSIILAIVQVPSAAISMYLMDKCGRRPLLMVSASVMCFCCFLVGLMFLLEENDYLTYVAPYLIVLGLWGYVVGFRLGMSGIPYLIMSEILPLNIKGSAGSLAAVTSSFCFWIVTFTFNFATNWSYSGAFFIFGGINVLALLFTVWLVPETNGRTLEEIQESLESSL